MKLPQDFKNRMKEYLKEDYETFMASYDASEVKGLRFNAVGDSMSPTVCFDGKYSFERISWEKQGFSYIVSHIAEEGGDYKKQGFSYIASHIAEGGSDYKESDSAADMDVNESSDSKESDSVPDTDVNACNVAVDMGFGRHPYHEAGAYYIQEPSAMAPVFYLDIKPGERVLDLCASPGGKSTQIGSKMQGKGILVSNEINSSRAKVLSENIERMGIKNALVINEDPRDISDRFYGFFDKILVDAPCSGEGMFRRSKTAIDEWSIDNVKRCALRQAWILDEAAKMLKDGGVIVYSTCTFSKEENENNIAAFLDRHWEFTLAEMKLFDGMERGFDNIGIRLYPHKIKGEGHYVCKLIKDGGASYDAATENTLETGNNTNIGSGAGYNARRNYRKSDNIGNSEGSDTGKNYRNSVNRGIGVGCNAGGNLRDIVSRSIEFEPDLSAKQKAGLSDMYSFVDSNLPASIKDEIMSKRLTMFGDNIYMLPDECPMLKGLKVLRPGLHIGTVKKNRFEPAHALAMAHNAADIGQSVNPALNCINIVFNSMASINIMFNPADSINISFDQSNCINSMFDSANGINIMLNSANSINNTLNSTEEGILNKYQIKDNNVIYKYILGETFSIDADITGWVLICVDGFSLGWGKAVNGIVKNHYPKGLRKQIKN